MPSDTTVPEISVVVATHDRAKRLAALLQSLRNQSLAPNRFEVVIVDDASSDGTPALLADEQHRSGLRLNVVCRERAEGPAAARNDGWRAATGNLIAFIDDDCVAVPKWLEAGLRTCADFPGAIVQGRVDPIPDEMDGLSPFTRTLRIHAAGPYYQTCNIFYPRELLQRLGGFDTLFTMPGGEDTDLAWRAISRGTQTAFASGAQAYHAVNRIGPLGRLRVAAHWHESMLVYKRYPELRDAVFTKRIFWKYWHYAFFRVVVAALLPRRLSFLRPYLILPYLHGLQVRLEYEHGRPAHALFYPLEDLVEVIAMVRASVRYRMIVL